MAYIPNADAPDYHAEVERRRGMVGNILRIHGIEPEVGPEQVVALRKAGMTDEEIHRVASVVAYFNFVNRIAEGLGVELEA